MSIFFIGAVAIAAYLISAVLQYRNLYRTVVPRKCIISTALLGVAAHTLTTYQLINTSSGIDLGFLNMATLIGWIVAVLATASSQKKSIDNLFVVLFPIAAFSLTAALIIPEGSRPRPDLSLGIVAHILLSILAYSVMMMAACQALVLAWQDKQLHLKRTGNLLNAMPPIQTMETLLFEMLWVGIILLTLSIATGAVYVDNLFAQHLAHKTLLTLTAWIVFATLLWGHHVKGWRGSTAIRLTLSAFFLLLLAYVGSSIVLQFILHRSPT